MNPGMATEANEVVSGTLDGMRRLVPLVIALTSVLAVLGIVRVTLASAAGQRWDDAAMATVYAGREAQLTVLSVLGRVSIGLVLAVLVFCVAAALLRGRFDLAIAAVVLVVGANVTTQVLKHVVLERPDFGLGVANSLPSGHTTVAASGAAAVVLVLPRVVRHLAATATAFLTTLVGTSTIVAAWHRPSDVVASLAVTAVWAGFVGSSLPGRWSLTRHEVTGAVLGSGAAVTALVAVGVRPVLGWDGFAEATLVLGAVSALTAVFTMAVCTAVPRAASPVGVAGPPTLDPVRA